MYDFNFNQLIIIMLTNLITYKYYSIIIRNDLKYRSSKEDDDDDAAAAAVACRSLHWFFKMECIEHDGR